uniref:Uncharacterized protein n=1 Tax=Rhizophagus irregularis (strain DAOM 181602 / DAOM 197198 / MUCL 43194) TaxID=747089 RepID=U9UKK2_RHIID
MFFVYRKEGKDEIFSGLFLDLAQDLVLSGQTWPILQFLDAWETQKGLLMREKSAVLYQNFDNISISFFFLGSFLVSLIGLWVSSGPSVLLEVLVSTFGVRLVVDFSLLIEWEK